MWNLNLLTKLTVFHSQTLFSLAIAVIAEAILMRISAKQVPSLHGVAPWYLKLVNSSNIWPFMLISTLMFVRFSELTFTLYAVALSMSLLVRS